MKPAATLASLLLAAALLGGCGGSDENSSTEEGPAAAPAKRRPAPAGARVVRCEPSAPGAKEIRAAGLDCDQAAFAIRAWKPGHCLPAPGGSRAGCRVGTFRCAAVASGRGYSVSCAAPGRSIAFTVPRRSARP
ncbi:MAG TPA: hypothetical protein VFJ99_04470 [Solirubrobacterales bacterium]|nr:hypothetical protein [Solirubrobacterales bacterium]